MRVVTLEGNPWFVAKDVCSVLFDADAVHHKGSTQYALYLDSDEKRLIPRATLATLGLIKGTNGGGGKGSLGFSESGLYKLIMRSDKPQARPFQDWVTREVLPSIRKTGAYELPAAPAALKGEVMPLPVDFADVVLFVSTRFATSLRRAHHR
ncbi:MAG: Bro-N domain-containing protein [Hyphomicrobiales bacterium]|nr:Bro-N domain-containing protein [Hyphomicrobiales bacterium]